MPNGVFVTAETVAGPVGALVTASAQALVAALAGALRCRPAKRRPSTRATAAAASGTRRKSVVIYLPPW
jgi:hypothetical protein